ncbi:MAG: helix-turn-helix domain-containing protein [Acidobacteriota bacterium]|jgi:DNA-binding NtrC family response regulator|nr:helix-turn-helix domain-containing protein [Acidobacteriota bacterium]
MDKKTQELADQFSNLTIKRQMRILAQKSANSRLYFREIMEEFEKTLLTAILEKNDYNVCRVSSVVKLHRNTITKKMKKLNIKEKQKKIKKTQEFKRKQF